MRPGARYPIAPWLDRSDVDRRRRLCLAIGYDVPNVIVLIASIARGSEWMLPAEVDANNLIPMRRDRKGID
jgi:hypothetical protein